MQFKKWLFEENEKIYIDLDNTLIDGDSVRPHAKKLIKNLHNLGDVNILTHGPTEYQKNRATKLGFDVPIIGRDNYDEVPKNKDAILIDDRPKSDYRTQKKLNTIGITPDRLVKSKHWKKPENEEGINDLYKKVKDLTEWIESDPQPSPKKQVFETYEKAKKMAEERLPKFRKLLRDSSDGHEVVTDIKTKKSFENKVQHRNRSPRKVFDVLRGAILVDKKPQMKKVLNLVKKNFLIKKVEHKDSPAKDFGYYGAIHIDVVVDDMICEIQITTKKLWRHKAKTDHLYKKNRAKSNPPKEDVEKMKLLYRKGNGHA